MNASREGRLRGQFEEHAGDEDDSDLEDGSDAEGGSFKVFARELDLIGEEDEMAPITLPRDPKVVGASEERRRLRKEKRVKEEGESSSFAAFLTFTDDCEQLNRRSSPNRWTTMCYFPPLLALLR